MQISEKPEFMKMLALCLASYSKPLPDAHLANVWFEVLMPFPLRVIAAAFTEYCDAEPTYPPIPAGIRLRCKTSDGRPGAEEAWAIALTSRDEAQTVVWTQEIAEAFAACRPVLEASNAISARMSFIEAYTRLVAAARGSSVPVQWSASLGWDLRMREAALTKASSAGLLAAPAVAALLPPPAGAPRGDSNAKQQINKIKEMLATMNAEKQREAELHAQRERDAVAARKQELSEQVDEYERKTA